MTRATKPGTTGRTINHTALILQMWKEGNKTAEAIDNIANKLGGSHHRPHIVSVLEKNSINWNRRTQIGTNACLSPTPSTTKNTPTIIHP